MHIEPTALSEQIGHRIRDERRAQGLTQEELALAANVVTRVIHYVEHGSVQPRLDTIERILSVLGMKLEVVPRVPGSASALKEANNSSAENRLAAECPAAAERQAPEPRE
jgi:transcriptional regulator with XRE-family HTH domain